MELKKALRLGERPRLALVGSGGKSTALFQLAREIETPVLVCATTHLSLEQIALADHHFILERIEDTNFLIERPLFGVVLLTGTIRGQRTQGLPSEIMEWLHQFCGYRSLPMLIEADGSRQMPLKAPAEHEPVIPDFVDAVVVVAGMQAVGQPLNAANVFRPERFASLSGLPLNGEITPQALASVLVHPQGGLKGIPEKARKMLLLNQADDASMQGSAREIAKWVAPVFDSVVIASLRQVIKPPTSVIYASIEPVAGIILAAGEASRYGAPKQLLRWQGYPLVWHVARKALAAGLEPVIVVSGAYADQLEQALKDLPVEIVHNPDWADGQSSSIHAGLRAMSAPGGGAIFLLADQPQVPELLLRQLVEKHAQTHSPIVAPLVHGQRANPVLFDRITFKDFEQLTGDVGGRKLFSSFPVEWVQWHDELPLVDIDTPQDFRAFQNQFGR